MKYILVVTLIFLFFELSQQYSAEDYCKLSSDHTACKTTTFGDDCKNPKLATITAADKKAMTDWHNSVRARAASGKETGAKDGTLPQGSNMRKLVWDEELAYIAQAWTKNCIFGHDGYDQRAVLDDRFNVIGQNGASYGTTGSLTPIDFVKVIKDWHIDEVKNLPKNVISNFDSGAGNGTIGHYTQVIWADTEAFGCGATIHTKGQFNTVYVFCNYAEAGNWGGEAIYKIGKPCSACPGGTSCSGSLCA